MVLLNGLKMIAIGLAMMRIPQGMHYRFFGKSLFFYRYISFIQLFSFDVYTLSQIPQVLQEQDCISPGKSAILNLSMLSFLLILIVLK